MQTMELRLDINVLVKGHGVFSTLKSIAKGIFSVNLSCLIHELILLLQD
jgi:hypothetical protein